MKIEVAFEGDIAVVGITGDIVASNAGRLTTEISKLIKNGSTNMLLDLGGVNFLDSTGLSACVNAHEKLKKENGLLVLSKPNETIRKVLRITGAEGKLTIAASRGEGLKILQSGLIK